MGDSLLVRLRESFQNKQEESWWRRVQENAHAFLALRGVKPCSASGAHSFDLLDAGPAPGTRQRQSVSILLHGVVIAALLLLGGIARDPINPKVPVGTGPLLVPLNRLLAAMEPRGRGAGSNHDLLPPTAGEMAPRARFVLVPPRLPDERLHELPVAPTLLDPNATTVTQIRNLGLPSMKDRNNSNGNDGGNTIGTKRGRTMGSTDDDDGGESDTVGPYAAGAYPVKCLYCPDPEYTDEARHEKLQGSVTLRVLVTRDGRAGQIKIMKGIGLGLDERSIEAVRGWRFQPARDANKNPIAQWVTVETTYRLF
jgi:periplasmic protein TonB